MRTAAGLDRRRNSPAVAASDPAGAARSISVSFAPRRPPPGAGTTALQQVGLARAVRAGQDHRLGADSEPRLAIGAEIGQHEPRHADALRRGTGIAAASCASVSTWGLYGVGSGSLPALSRPLSLHGKSRRLSPAIAATQTRIGIST